MTPNTHYESGRLSGERDDHINHLTNLLTTTHTRLLEALDTLDTLSARHAEELGRVEAERDALGVKMRRYVRRVREAEAEREDMRDAVGVLVERVEASNRDLSNWPKTKMGLSSLASPALPVPSSSRPHKDQEQDHEALITHATSLILTLQHSLESERRANVRAQEKAERKREELEGKVKRREAELEAILGATTTAAAIHGQGQTMSADDMVSILDWTNARNSELEAEVRTLTKRIEQAKAKARVRSRARSAAANAAAGPSTIPGIQMNTTRTRPPSSPSPSTIAAPTVVQPLLPSPLPRPPSPQPLPQISQPPQRQPQDTNMINLTEPIGNMAPDRDSRPERLEVVGRPHRNRRRSREAVSAPGERDTPGGGTTLTGLTDFERQIRDLGDTIDGFVEERGVWKEMGVGVGVGQAEVGNGDGALVADSEVGLGAEAGLGRASEGGERHAQVIPADEREDERRRPTENSELNELRARVGRLEEERDTFRRSSHSLRQTLIDERRSTEAQIGELTGQIKDLSGQVRTLDAQLAEAIARIESLTAQVEVLEAGGVNQRVSEDDEVERLRGEIRDLEDRLRAQGTQPEVGGGRDVSDRPKKKLRRTLETTRTRSAAAAARSGRATVSAPKYATPSFLAPTRVRLSSSPPPPPTAPTTRTTAVTSPFSLGFTHDSEMGAFEPAAASSPLPPPHIPPPLAAHSNRGLLQLSSGSGSGSGSDLKPPFGLEERAVPANTTAAAETTRPFAPSPSSLLPGPASPPPRLPHRSPPGPPLPPPSLPAISSPVPASTLPGQAPVRVMDTEPGELVPEPELEYDDEEEEEEVTIGATGAGRVGRRHGPGQHSVSTPVAPIADAVVSGSARGISEKTGPDSESGDAEAVAEADASDMDLATTPLLTSCLLVLSTHSLDLDPSAAASGPAPLADEEAAEDVATGDADTNAKSGSSMSISTSLYEYQVDRERRESEAVEVREQEEGERSTSFPVPSTPPTYTGTLDAHTHAHAHTPSPTDATATVTVTATLTTTANSNSRLSTTLMRLAPPTQRVHPQPSSSPTPFLPARESTVTIRPRSRPRSRSRSRTLAARSPTRSTRSESPEERSAMWSVNGTPHPRSSRRRRSSTSSAISILGTPHPSSRHRSRSRSVSVSHRSGSRSRHSHSHSHSPRSRQDREFRAYGSRSRSNTRSPRSPRSNLLTYSDRASDPDGLSEWEAHEEYSPTSDQFAGYAFDTNHHRRHSDSSEHRRRPRSNSSGNRRSSSSGTRHSDGDGL